jgi:hypothetical protein
MLDDYVANLDPQTRAAGEKAAKPWLDELKAPGSAMLAPLPAMPTASTTPAK